MSETSKSSALTGHLTAAFGELVGTSMFLFVAEGGAKTANLARTAAQQGTAAPLDSQTIMMISTCFGLSLLVCAFLFFRISGGLFNPAITVALWLAGVLTSMRAILLFGAQVAGGLIASALVLGLTPLGSGDVDVVNTSLSDNTTYAQGFMLELLGTSVLVFSVLMLAVEKHRGTFLAPIGIGLTLFALHLFLVSYTGCGLNPARSFGPAAVGKKFPEHHEIYWVAPLLGGILSVIYYEILRAVKYNSAVLDQDSDKEVTGLRPVHMRVYKRLAGHKDWEADKEERKLHILRRRRARVARQRQQKEMLDVMSDDESVINSPVAPPQLSSTYMPGDAPRASIETIGRQSLASPQMNPIMTQLSPASTAVLSQSPATKVRDMA